jgi:hypothetical protein
MTNREMLTTIDGSILEEAFPTKHRVKATLACKAVSHILNVTQWTDRFSVQVEGEQVQIPVRLRFASDYLPLLVNDEAWQFGRALQTRSNDGFERQRAARDLLAALQPWQAPFIVGLIGEYIVEILDDIAAALTTDNTRILSDFIGRNPAYWNTTKRRVASYWNAYYRSSSSSSNPPAWAVKVARPRFRRSDYVGFSLIKHLDVAANGRITDTV